MENGQTEWEHKWQFLLEHAKTRPAMWIGSQEHGHQTAITDVLRLVWQAKVFTKPKCVTVDLSPNQYVVRCETGPLIKPVQEIFSFGVGHILEEKWSDESRTYFAHINREDGERNLQFEDCRWRRGWRYCFAGPTGPRLSAATNVSVLAHRFIWGLRTNSGLWCQSFREGWPVSKSFLLPEPSPVGIFAAAYLNRDYFTGLPFNAKDVERFLCAAGTQHLNSRPKWTMPGNITLCWHEREDLLNDKDLQPENTAQWLAGH